MCIKKVVRSTVVAGGHRLTFPKSSPRQCQLVGCLSLLDKGEFLEYTGSRTDLSDPRLEQFRNCFCYRNVLKLCLKIPSFPVNYCIVADRSAGIK